jgi:hypothetical protein
MRLLNGLLLTFLFTAAVFAQNRGFSPQPFLTGTFGSVLFPAGTAALPGVQRTFPNAVFPAGMAPHLVVPFSSNDPTRLTRNFGNLNRGFYNGGFYNGQLRGLGTTVVPYAVPVYVPDYGFGYDNGYGNSYGYPPQQPAPQQPNVIVVYPPPPQPVVVGGDNQLAAGPPPAAPPGVAQAPEQSSEPSHYLIAFKDHSIFSVVAYWVEGDTLHYFTSPSTHNQVSLSLVDRDLTERLNREAGITVNLPKN